MPAGDARVDGAAHRRGAAVCVAVYLASRLALEAVGLGARALILPMLPPGTVRWHYAETPALAIWGVWDTGWFIDIARDGYMRSVIETGPLQGAANWAFFPLYPLAGRAVAALTGLPIFASLLLVSNLAFLAALLVVWRLCRALSDEQVATCCVTLLAFVPGSYVFSSGYSELLFLLWVAGTLAALHQRAWLLAGALAALATLTRNTGILLLLPMCVAWGAAWRGGTPRPIVFAAAVSLPLLALGGWMAFLWAWAGDPLAFVHIQAAWGRTPMLPTDVLLAVTLYWRELPPELAPSAMAAWLSVRLCGLVVRQRNWPHAVLAVAMVVVGLSSGLLSYVRFVLVMLPLFVAAAIPLARRPRVFAVGLGTLAILNGLMMVSWALGVRIY